MRNLVIINLILLLQFFSCSDNEESVTFDPFLSAEFVKDGTTISGMQLYCIKLNDESYSSLGFSSYEDYLNSIKSVDSYSDFCLKIEITANGETFHFNNKEQEHTLQNKLYSYLHDKTNIIKKDIEDHHNKYESVAGNTFFTAYINGEITITCDKVLFEQSPGQNLMNYFKISNNYSCQPIGIVEPYSFYHYNEIKDNPADISLPNGSWLKSDYQLELDVFPEERYEEITFHIRIPLLKEYAGRYVASLIKDIDFGDRYEKIILESDTKIKFSSY